MQRERVRVLLVDDDQGDFEMTRAMISEIESREMDLEWVSTFEEGLEALERDDHDVYLVDFFLEDRSGMDFLREARKRSVRAPLIMLTGRGSRDVDLQAMRAGASDYLVKGRIDPELLERSIRFSLERARAEEALRESEKRHRGMFDHLPVGLYRSRPDGDFVDANPALVRLLGYPTREVLQNRYAPDLYVSPDDRDRFWELLQEQGIVRSFETRLERYDGSTVPVRNTARVHRDSVGRIEYVEGMVEEVGSGAGGTGADGEDGRFRALFEESDTPVALVDADGLITEVNDAFSRVFDMEPWDVAGASFVDLAVPDERGQLLRILRLLARGDRSRAEGEHRFAAPDGTVIWSRTKLRALPGSPGDPSALLALFEEVSEDGVGAR